MILPSLSRAAGEQLLHIQSVLQAAATSWQGSDKGIEVLLPLGIVSWTNTSP